MTRSVYNDSLALEKKIYLSIYLSIYGRLAPLLTACLCCVCGGGGWGGVGGGGALVQE